SGRSRPLQHAVEVAEQLRVLDVAMRVEGAHHALAPAASASIFAYSGRAGARVVPAGTARYSHPCSRRSPPSRRSSCSWAVENGSTGCSNTFNALITLRAVASVSAACAVSVFTAFHGARSSRYLFADWASLSASCSAPRKWHAPNSLPTASNAARVSARIASDSGARLPTSGTVPPKFLWIIETTRFERLPHVAMRTSLLARIRSSSRN